MSKLIQDIILDLTEEQIAVVYANQNDKNSRLIRCHIQNVGEDYSLDGCSVKFRCKKSNGYGIYKDIGSTDDGTGEVFGSISGNIVEIPVTNKMTASSGTQICDLEIINSEGTIYTCVFKLRVSEGALDGTEIEDSDDYSSIIDTVNGFTGELNDIKSANTSQDNLINYCINNTYKNVFKHEATNSETNGLVFTVNDDKSVTVNGTATEDTTFYLGSIYLDDLGLGCKYSYSGTPPTGSSSTYYTLVSHKRYAGSSTYNLNNYSGDTTVVTNGVYDYVDFQIVIIGGYTATNLKFYPMVRRAELDRTYQPYNSPPKLIGDLEELITTNKNNIVEAINENSLLSKILEKRVNENTDDILSLENNKLGLETFGSYVTANNKNLSDLSNGLVALEDKLEDSYLTSTEAESKFATKTQVSKEISTEISNLIGTAPETLDTLGEISKALTENQEVVDALNESIAEKANSTDLEDYLPLEGGTLTGLLTANAGISASNNGATNALTLNNNNSGQALSITNTGAGGIGISNTSSFAININNSGSAGSAIRVVNSASTPSIEIVQTGTNSPTISLDNTANNAPAINVKNTSSTTGIYLQTSGEINSSSNYAVNGKAVYEYVSEIETQLDDKYDSTTTRTAKTFLAAPKDADGVATFRKISAVDLPTYVHAATGTAGSTGYVKIATFKTSGTYQNEPIVIELSRRAAASTCTLYIAFASEGDSDPAISANLFRYIGTNFNCYLYKSATSTFDLYVQKSEGYDNIGVVRYHKPSYMNGTSITWTNVHASSVPSGATAATLSGNIASATKAKQDDSGNIIVDTYATKNELGAIFENDIDIAGNSIYAGNIYSGLNIEAAGNVTATTFTGKLEGNAKTATTATTATKLSNTSAIGSTTKPVYFNASGVPVAGTYTLAAACAKGVTDSTSAGAFSSTGTNLVTERDVYYGLPKINGVKTYNSDTVIYAPIDAGTNGYVLRSVGSGAPAWVGQNSLKVGSATKATQDADGNVIADTYEKKLTSVVAWENASPTASFATTTITLSDVTISDYTYYEVEYKHQTGQGNISTGVLKLLDTASTPITLMCIGRTTSNGSTFSPLMLCRPVIIYTSTNEIYFSNCSNYYGATSASTTAYNSFLIPCKVTLYK